MAIETKCLMDGFLYNIKIDSHSVIAEVHFPYQIELGEEEATVLEHLIHNQLELVLMYYAAIKNPQTVKPKL